ncbi:antitoxin Xre-like helix-turn-helix domain-containing protein [Bosea sp. UC22_33]|uniref:antitoxin Xre-like helix-turn-helix domain-containing protein n=1 Tax=Bosea sp. UC22_33 TaxID=3350165 RepID=UPI00366F45D6
MGIPRQASKTDIPRITANEAAAAARAVVKLFERWKLDDALAREMLGGLPARTYARWKTGEQVRISRDVATRLSLLMGIHKALRLRFIEPERGYAWVNKGNDTFGGRTPVEIMSEGSIFSLARIRACLDAECGG